MARTAEAIKRQIDYRLKLISKLERQLEDQRRFHALRKELADDGKNPDAWWLSAATLRQMIAQRERNSRRESRSAAS